ncbi:MAG: alpha/beta fold hydrolase [Polyangiaceae bacterium]|nr:alpha/beta fold hydrolase [Polyangiaceae bacterium]
MARQNHYWLVVVALGAACNSATPTTGTGTGAGAPPSARTSPAAVAPLEWTLRLTGGATPSEALPLVVAMHGLGDRPETFGELYSSFAVKARFVLLRAPDPWGSGFSWFPFRDGDGDELRARGISAAAERVVATFATLEAKYPTRGKPVVTGFSQGGMLSFAIAARYPDRVRAALPIGGVLPAPLWPTHDAGSPAVRIVALHGESDERVPLGPTQAGVAALRSHGFDARIESFPGVGHTLQGPLRARYFELLKAALEGP